MSNIVKMSSARTPKLNKSAVSRVQKCGLDLVKSKPMRGKRATQYQMAKIDFAPWNGDDKEKVLQRLSEEQFHQYAVACRLAYAAMLRTKDQLIEGHATLEHKMVDEMMGLFFQVAEDLKFFASIIEQAYIRTEIAACAHNVRGGKFKGVHDMRRKKRVLRRA